MPGIKDVIIGLDTSSSPLVAVVERGGKKYASRRKGVKQERLLFPVLKRCVNENSNSTNLLPRANHGPGRAVCPSIKRGGNYFFARADWRGQNGVCKRRGGGVGA